MNLREEAKCRAGSKRLNDVVAVQMRNNSIQMMVLDSSGNSFPYIDHDYRQTPASSASSVSLTESRQDGRWISECWQQEESGAPDLCLLSTHENQEELAQNEFPSPKLVLESSLALLPPPFITSFTHKLVSQKNAWISCPRLGQPIARGDMFEYLCSTSKSPAPFLPCKPPLKGAATELLDEGDRRVMVVLFSS